jgi:hypothetical protein
LSFHKKTGLSLDKILIVSSRKNWVGFRGASYFYAKLFKTSSSITAIPVCYFNSICYMNGIVFSFESALFDFQPNNA